MPRPPATGCWCGRGTSGGSAPGGFAWLPLGLMVARNVERIVREEMVAIGGQEVQFPALVPRAPYEATGRWREYGDSLFRVVDRRGADHLLAPTHEEMFTLAVRDMCSSYRDLPLILFQIQAKYRDEARPRGGLLRGREFTMKDAYSFDVDDDGPRPQLRPPPRRLPAHLRPPGAAVRDRCGPRRGDGRVPLGGVPGVPADRRGHVRPLPGLRAAPPTPRRCTSPRRP